MEGRTVCAVVSDRVWIVVFTPPKKATVYRSLTSSGRHVGVGVTFVVWAVVCTVTARPRSQAEPSTPELVALLWLRPQIRLGFYCEGVPNSQPWFDRCIFSLFHACSRTIVDDRILCRPEYLVQSCNAGCLYEQPCKHAKHARTTFDRPPICLQMYTMVLLQG
nr:hypothetical protein CFP56_30775 [Quercus suber]